MIDIHNKTELILEKVEVRSYFFIASIILLRDFSHYNNKINKKINIINNNCCNLKKSVI